MKGEPYRLIATVLLAGALMARGPDALAQTVTQSGDIVSLAGASDVAIHYVMPKGSVAFQMPRGWFFGPRLLPPFSSLEFHFPDYENAAGSTSTRITLLLDDLDLQQGPAASADLKKAAAATKVIDQYHGWTVRAHEETQGSVVWSSLFTTRELPEAHAVVFVLIDWPRGGEHETATSQAMTATYHKLLDSISAAAGPYTAKPGEGIRHLP